MCIRDRYEQEDTLYIAFQESYAKWRCSNISSYKFTYKVTGGFGPCGLAEIVATVENGFVTNTELTEQSISKQEICLNTRTIEDYYEILEKAVTASLPIENPVIVHAIGQSLLIADRVNAEYDNDFGIPTNYYIDYIFGLADEEFGIEITQFELL